MAVEPRPQEPSLDIRAEREQPLSNDAPDASTGASDERLLVCIGPSPADRILRATQRMAARLQATWTATYVETPQHSSYSAADRDRVTQSLRLAESLGAKVVTLAADRVSDAVGAYAKSQRITRIVLGKPTHARWQDLVFGSLIDEVVRASGEADVYVISGEADLEDRAKDSLLPPAEPSPPTAYGAGLLILLGTIILAAAVDRHFGLTEVSMVYLLGTVLVALRYGRWVSLLISALSVATLDFMFVPPRYSFSVSDGRHIFTFIGMFVVGLVISNLAARVRWQADMALRREQRTRALYELTHALSRESDVKALVRRAAHYVADFFHGQALVLLPAGQAASSISLGGFAKSQDLEPAGSTSEAFVLDEKERGVARWVFEHNAVAGLGTATLPGHSALYAPLSSTGHCIGVLVLRPNDQKQLADAEQRNLLFAFSDQIVIALERAIWAEEAQRSASGNRRGRL